MARNGLPRALWSGVFLAACGAQPAAVLPPAPPPPAASAIAVASPPADATPPTEKLATDTPRVTNAGTTFTAPADWTIQKGNDSLLLVGPEPDFRVAVVEAKGSTADDAVKLAWLAVHFDFGKWKTQVATRKNDDGTTTMHTIAPGMGGLEFIVSERDGKRALVVRDDQHEYVFLETS